jgi:hypothetical protein
MQVIQSFDPSAARSGNIQVGSVDPGSKILLYNLSLTTIQLNFNNGSTDLLHAGEARFWTLDGNTPVIEWATYTTLPGTPNSSIITGTLYGANEPLPGTYPVALTYQTYSNGGTVTTNQQNLIQDGQALNTTFIEATHIASASSNVVIDNSGNLLLSSNPRTSTGGPLTVNTQLLKVDATNNLITFSDPSTGGGVLQFNGPFTLPYPSVQTLVTGSTINLNNGALGVVTCAAAVTGIIMATPTLNTGGQMIFLYNSGSSSITFAASGSHVRNGSNASIGGGRLAILLWDGSNWTTCP